MDFQVTGLGSENTWNEIAKELEEIWAHALSNLKKVLEKEQEK